MILIQQELFSTFTEKKILLVKSSYKSFTRNEKKQKTVVTLANYLPSETRTLKDFVGNEWVRSCLKRPILIITHSYHLVMQYIGTAADNKQIIAAVARRLSREFVF